MYKTRTSDVSKTPAQQSDRTDRTKISIVRRHTELADPSRVEENITFTNKTRGNTAKDYAISFLHFITCKNCFGQSHPDKNIPLSELAHGKQPKPQEEIKSHIDSATNNQESLPLDTLKSKIEEIEDKHRWLSRKTGKGVEEYNIQKELNNMLDIANQSFNANDDKTLIELDSIIYEFNTRINSTKMDKINENYEWLISNMSHVKPGEIAAYQRNLQEIWKAADSALRKPIPDVATLDRAYQSFKRNRKTYEKTRRIKTARDVNRHLTNVSQLSTLTEDLLDIKGLRERGSLPSTIMEGGSSEFASRTSSQMGVKGG